MWGVVNDNGGDEIRYRFCMLWKEFWIFCWRYVVKKWGKRNIGIWKMILVIVRIKKLEGTFGNSVILYDFGI